MEHNNQTEQFRKYLTPIVTFSDEQWELFISYLSCVRIRKKEHFTVAEKVCDNVGYILNGSVRYYHIKDGLEITNYFSMEDEMITSYKSFITRQPGTNYIQALEHTDLILISYKNLQLMLDHPLLGHQVERFGRRVAEHTICCYEDRVHSFITQSPEERYLAMLEIEQKAMQRIPQHYIANYLGITPVSLSRIRRRSLIK
jgi:CRP-like cAMP-binding protein